MRVGSSELGYPTVSSFVQVRVSHVDGGECTGPSATVAHVRTWSRGATPASGWCVLVLACSASETFPGVGRHPPFPWQARERILEAQMKLVTVLAPNNEAEAPAPARHAAATQAENAVIKQALHGAVGRFMVTVGRTTCAILDQYTAAFAQAEHATLSSRLRK